jgi:glutathione S-transferase
MARLKLYEVAGEDVNFRPSPYCWRIRMALAHEGLAFEPVPWRAVEKEGIAPSGGGTVPVLVDGGRWIRESWDIALYLETAHPNRPSLFNGDGDRTKSYFIDGWTTNIVHPVIARAVLLDQFPLLAAKDQSYYQERTKRKFGVTLEELCRDQEGAIAQLQGILSPLQQVLERSDFLGGDRPGYGDYIVFGAFQWARVASRRRLVDDDSPVRHWFLRLLNAFDGFAASQPDRSHWI